MKLHLTPMQEKCISVVMHQRAYHMLVCSGAPSDGELKASLINVIEMLAEKEILESWEALEMISQARMNMPGLVQRIWNLLNANFSIKQLTDIDTQNPDKYAT